MILVGSDGERITLGEEESGGGGVLVPLPGPPGKDSMVPGPPGRNVDGITISGDDLVFDMSLGPDITVSVPAISEANEAAGRAEGAADLAVETAAGIQDVAEDAAQVARDRLAVESAASAVATDRQTVSDARGVVVTAKGDVEQIQTDVVQVKASIENTVTLVEGTLEQYGVQFIADRQASEQAVTDATALAKRSEDAADAADEKAGEASQSAAEAKQFRDEAAGVVTGVSSFEGVSGAVTKAQVGLDQVDNTRDLDKPTSNETRMAFENFSDYFTLLCDAINTDLATKLNAAQVQTIANAAAAAIVDGSPEALDTLVELAAALGNDPNFATTVMNLIGQKAASDDPRFTDARTPKGTTRAVWNAGTADAANLGLTPAELKEAVVTHIAATDPKSTIGGAAIIKVGTVPYDTTLPGAAEASPRKVGYNDCQLGLKLQRAVTFTSVTFRGLTADASGNLVVELRKNGTAVSGTSTTIAAGNQVAGGTSTGTWAFAEGDVLTVYVTGVGTTPGKGLVADLKGLA